MKYLILCILFMFGHSEVISYKGKHYAYHENCYGTSMELSFYEVQSLANNNEELVTFVSTRYEPCINNFEKLYTSDGFARDINYKPICSEKEYNKYNRCPATKQLNKSQIVKIIQGRILE